MMEAVHRYDGSSIDRREYQRNLSNRFVSSIRQPLPCFVAPERPAAAGYIGCESLDEAEPLQP
jgi:hypothetical protein